MTRVVKFSESATLALHAMGYLAGHSGLVPLKEIAHAFQVSEAHLSKVMQRLNKSGLVRGSRGPLGGYTLVRNPEEIRLIEIYEAIEGPFKTHCCLFEQPTCPGKGCPLGGFIGGLENQLQTQLTRTNLAEMVRGMEGGHDAP